MQKLAIKEKNEIFLNFYCLQCYTISRTKENENFF